MISDHFQGKPYNITVIQGYAPTSKAEEADVERFCEDLQDLLELTPKKEAEWASLWSRAVSWRKSLKTAEGEAVKPRWPT